MLSEICFIYPWATTGGVERMLLNRMISFKKFLPELKVDIIFFHDAGGLLPLQFALKAHAVNARAFIANSFEESKRYDIVFCIDCPQAFHLCEQKGFRYVIECHTGYPESRKYLEDLPKSCVPFIIVPSPEFSMQISREVVGLDTMVLRNFVPDIALYGSENYRMIPGWCKRPLFFFSRMDELKNPVFLLDAFVELEKKTPGRFFLLMCGNQMPDIDMRREIGRRKLSASTMLLPAVDFLHSMKLMRIVKECGGIFISPSKNESFGLSAAEAISIGMPTLLSDIPAHKVLVGFSPELTFPLDDPGVLVEKIIWVANRYDAVSNQMQLFRANFSPQGFIDDWIGMVKKLSES